jgi:3-deoxy-manno-octulosonate cytidylyltransferase (CMP-KDO synthetase)
MSVAIVLPARLASTRLPNKLLLDRSGKTLLEHTIERAQLAQKAYPKLFTTIRVACDDEKLVAAAKRAGADAVMTRKDHQSGTDRIAEAAKDLKEEIIVNLQADEPEIDPESIATVARQVTRFSDHPSKNFKESNQFGLRDRHIAPPMGTLAVPIFDEEIFRRTSVVKVICNHEHEALYFSRAPIPFAADPDAADLLCRQSDESGRARRVLGYHHIGIYSYQRDFLLFFQKLKPSKLEKLEKLEQLRVLENGYTIQVGIVEKNNPGIDTPEDYEAFLVRQRNKK